MALDSAATMTANVKSALVTQGFIVGTGGVYDIYLEKLITAIMNEIYTQLTTKAKANDTGTDGAESGQWSII